MSSFKAYSEKLQDVLASTDWTPVETLASDLLSCWRDKRQVFICGNGGSAANAQHMANDLIYGAAGGKHPGLRVHALPANTSIVTCLANDKGYDTIFADQLSSLAASGDLLITMSGSGNSPNILEALRVATEIGMKSVAILGYSGGKAKDMADLAIHTQIDDMQISEDMQLIISHMIMQHLCGTDTGSG